MTPLSGYDLSKTGSPQKLLSTVTEEDPNNLTIVRIENDQRPSFVDLFVSPESSSTNAHLDSHETPKHIGASSDLASESAGRNIESNVVLTSSNIINATDKSLISGKEMAGSSIPVSPIDDVGGSSQSISADFASWFRVDPPVCNLPAFGGISKHKLTNYGTLRVAFKVRSTNNTHYQFKPVFGIIESLSSTTLQIIRTCGPPGKSRLLILCKEATADVANLASFFRKGPFLGESVIMLNAT
ncbi:hypothetical protein AB6A40_010969 [Gnathostoma spinigerum]|uniref:Major sperm protein n=1 Tax=Gnathostoma spinigerum TaxID=75299 RepID=A0ABD6EWE8_9BILA